MPMWPMSPADSNPSTLSTIQKKNQSRPKQTTEDGDRLAEQRAETAARERAATSELQAAREVEVATCAASVVEPAVSEPCEPRLRQPKMTASERMNALRARLKLNV